MTKEQMKDYAKVRKDLNAYLHTNNITKVKFCEDNGCSLASLYRFLSGSNPKQSGNVMDVAIKVLYGDEDCKEEEQEPVKEESENVDIEDSLDATIMKLLDKKIEKVCEEIKSKESDLKKLQDSREIIRKLLG